jgi:CBS domain-containing protein
MGEQKVQDSEDEDQKREFMKALLADVRALEYMLEQNQFETGIRRIGAEQEMFLVDQACNPSLSAEQMMEQIEDPRFTFELAQFNLEANLSPLELTGDCLHKLEQETVEVVKIARRAAFKLGNDVVLVGILPTLTADHLTLDSMVPKPRYRALNDAIVKLRGSEFELSIKGTDDLDLVHDNVMLEACNASFQIHFQVAPEEFANLYNLAQAVTGPVLAAAVNSPLLLGRRLWHETRIAVFEHSIDARSEAHRARGHQPRVHFGNDWVEQSVLEIFKEDIASFRVVLTTESDEDPVALAERGGVPQLNALRLHNGTVYRWNRACYGITDGKPHLRIEQRALPSGPTVYDEVANAAFFFGLMSEMATEIDDIRERMSFADARSNFLTAARYGLKAQFTWIDGQQLTAIDLIIEHLLPAARRGLQRVNIRNRDIERYLGLIEKRVMAQQSGARWALDSISAMGSDKTMHERLRNLTSSIIKQQKNEKPVHEWELAEFCESQDWRDSFRTIGQFMTTDLFTVRPDDLMDFAASLMDWKHIRHVPVEDDSGCLVGLVSHRSLLRILAHGLQEGTHTVVVKEIMEENPTTVGPECPTVEAMRIMRELKVACLPVVGTGNRLVGVIAEADLLRVAGKLLETFLEQD